VLFASAAARLVVSSLLFQQIPVVLAELGRLGGNAGLPLIVSSREARYSKDCRAVQRTAFGDVTPSRGGIVRTFLRTRLRDSVVNPSRLPDGVRRHLSGLPVTRPLDRRMAGKLFHAPSRISCSFALQPAREAPSFRVVGIMSTVPVCFRDPLTATTPNLAAEWCCGHGICTDFRCPARLVSAASSEKHFAIRCGTQTRKT
jgi:hypothetical protein